MMLPFILGIATGVVLTILAAVLCFVVIISLANRHTSERP